jgi:PAS domain S-box-containing protein
MDSILFSFISTPEFPSPYIIALFLSCIIYLCVFFLALVKIFKYKKEIEGIQHELGKKNEALEQSENKFKTLFDNISDEVYVTDFQGNFTELNQIACNSLGYSRGELLQMNFSDIKSKKYRPYVSENIKIVLQNGYHTHETEHVSKTGQIITYEMKSKLIDYEGKSMILTIARNISERKAIEKKIVQTIIETEMKERKRFSADLHDGLGPVLSTIKLYSDLIKKGNFTKMSIEEAVSNIDELVEMAISATKEISNNITPNVLDDFGLAVAITEFCSYIIRTKSINIDLDTKNYNLNRKGIETTILFQTVKELINNTIKHANARNIRIELKSAQNQIILYYRDDGIGFNFEKEIEEGKGLGINNILNKIKTIKGICDFNSSPGKGTLIIISLKLDDTLQNE